MDTLINQFQQTSLVEWLGTLTGLIGVYLSIKEKVLAWPFFIICYGLYAYLSYSASLYAAMSMNACFIPIAIYGWRQWSGSQKNNNAQNETGHELRIRSMLKPTIGWTIAIGIVGTIAIGTLLSRYTEGAAPYLDSFATTISFLAQWMLSKKYIQNWLAWIAADLAFVILWGSQGYWVAVAMFLIFTALAVFGFLSWKKEMQANAA
jgi:nicotinamide mononucleotide transporter